MVIALKVRMSKSFLIDEALFESTHNFSERNVKV